MLKEYLISAYGWGKQNQCNLLYTFCLRSGDGIEKIILWNLFKASKKILESRRDLYKLG